MWQFLSQVSDIHGEITHISKKTMKKQNLKLTENDYLIICGDFAGVWFYPESRYYKQDLYLQKWLSKQPWTTLFVDGNHENHDLLNQYPVEEWHGGKVHHIVKDKIIHLMRGQVFNIEGQTFFTMGGAQSHDMGIRKEWINWWANEIPNIKEFEEGTINLEKVNWKVDYIISHCCSTFHAKEILGKVWFAQDFNSLTYYFDKILENVEYKHWYCGHYHMNKTMPKNLTVLYHKIIPCGTTIDF